MATQPDAVPSPKVPSEETVEVPRPTVAPMVLALGMVLLGGGSAFGSRVPGRGRLGIAHRPGYMGGGVAAGTGSLPRGAG